MKTGMVSAEIQRRFSERGVRLIPPSTGSRMLIRELGLGRKGQVEIVVGDGPWEAVDAARPPSPPDALPFLNGVPLKLGTGGAVELIRVLDPGHDPYLQDHRLDGKAVFPAAMAVELMAELVQEGWPEWEVVGIRALRVLKGIVLEDGSKSIRVTARPQTQPSQEQLELDVDVEITALERPSHPCYRATVQLAGRLPEPPCYELPSCSGLHASFMSADEAYRRCLFHGPLFQSISTIEEICEQGIIATITSTPPQRCLAGNPAGTWLIDPIVLDSGPQLAIIWANAYKNMTALPASFQCYRRFGSVSDSPLRCYFQVLPTSEDHTVHANVFFVDSDNRLVGLLEGLESTCSKALNRLGPRQAHQTEGGSDSARW
jgi:hypothetical protein